MSFFAKRADLRVCKDVLVVVVIPGGIGFPRELLARRDFLKGHACEEAPRRLTAVLGLPRTSVSRTWRCW